MKKTILISFVIALSFLFSHAQTALDFDGTDDYVECGNGINLANQSFTVEWWAKRTGSGTVDNIFGHGTQATNNGLHGRFEASDALNFGFYGNDFITSPGSWATDGLWHHYAFTYDVSTNERIIYVDGVFIDSDISSADYIGSGHLYLGQLTGAPGIQQWHGQMDDFRVWNITRSQTEIQARMNECLTGSETGLLALYDFEDGAGSSSLTDITANGNDGTLTNMDPATDWVLGMACDLTFQTALDFDGTDDYVVCGDSLNLVNQSFTVELWAKRIDTGIVNNIFGHGTTSMNNGLHARFEASDVLKFGFFTNDLVTPPGSWATDGLWHHYAFTYDVSTNERIIYVDGDSVTSDISASDYIGSGVLYLGQLTGAPGSELWAGQMDDFRIWNTTRSQTEIQESKSDCLTGSKAGLLALYNFEDGAGSSSLTDITGNGNNGTLENMDPATDWVLGVPCGLDAPIALAFEGSNDYVDCGNDISLDLSTQWTAECWINPTAISGGWYTFLSKNFHDNSEGFGMHISSGTVNLWKGGGGASETVSASISASIWTHVAGVYDSGTWTLYVDGVDMGSFTETFVNASTPLYIGARNSNDGTSPNDFFPGKIDHVRLWDVALSQAEIQQSMSICISGSEDGLIAAYDFEDGIGSTTVTDLTGNGNVGTLTNMDPLYDWVTGVSCCPVIDTSISSLMFTLTANEIGSTYQWLDCPGMTPIGGETSQSFTATTNGSYAVAIDNGCYTDTSACVFLSPVGLSESNLTTPITVYPNPSEGKFSIDLGSANGASSITIMNLSGQAIYSKTVKDQQVITMQQNFPAGLYILYIEKGGLISTTKLIIK